MSTSSTSDAAIDSLLAGGTLGSPATVGPLAPDEVRLLRVLWRHREELQSRKGGEQAAALRRLAGEAMAGGNEVSGNTVPDAPPPSGPEAGVAGAVLQGDEKEASRTRWRLLRLRCHAFRGVAPFGTDFAFDFDGASILLYGPNGAGKSSLLNAVGWVFTGRICTDGGEESDSFPVYSVTGKRSKLHDWPVARALPAILDPASAPPDCWAEVTLTEATGNRTLALRRSVGGTLEVCEDGIAWKVCDSLATYDISPLDVQLSISAAVVFGRRNLEATADARTLLSMFLGYDALEEFAGLLTTLSSNLTKAAKASREDAAAKRTQVRSALSQLPHLLSPGTRSQEALSALTQGDPSSEAIAAADTALADAAEQAGRAVAAALGLQADDPIARRQLIDALTTGVAKLQGQQPEALYPNLIRLAPEFSLPSGEGTPAERIVAVEASLADFEASAKRRVAARWEWWQREAATGGRAGLLIQAAQHFHPETGSCPVCEQSIVGRAVAAELDALRGANQELWTGLREFFRGLADELSALLPELVAALDDRPAPDRLRGDWEGLRRALGAALAPVVDRYAPRVEALIAGVEDAPAPAPDILPPGADEVFRAEAAGLGSALARVRRALVRLSWAERSLPGLLASLAELFTEEAGAGAETVASGPGSLLAVLLLGKQAAADLTPLVSVRDALAGASRLAKEAEDADATTGDFEGYRAAIDGLKPIGKFAESQVGQILQGIQDRMLEHYHLLCPRGNRQLTPSRLQVNRGRDRSVDTFLAGGGFEVPSQHVSNAGQLRALALAFYFALLERHPGGLAFAVLDDPILSLDEDHRESWAAHVLRPCLGRMQVILATHQRQFLINCSADFRPGLLLELNHRDFSPQITWRPGHRLDRAAVELERAWTNAPTEMRKYREGVLIALDAYSAARLFNPGNLTGSLEAYERLAAPHPLAGTSQNKIVQRLRSPRVGRVLDPGSHALTESDVTRAMVEECLRELRELDGILGNELDRLDDLRKKEQQNKILQGSGQSAAPAGSAAQSGQTPGDEEEDWVLPLPFRVIGRAAAQTHGCVVMMSEDPEAAECRAARMVLVASDTLAPIARPGQWALLAPDDEEPGDNDLVAAIDRSKNTYLRRAWIDGDHWLLEAVNPLAGVAPVRLPRGQATVRKVVGVLYEPKKAPARGGRKVCEWTPREDFPKDPLKGLQGIHVDGSSLDPIAFDGQVVLVGARFNGGLGSLGEGSLAVVETTDDDVGNVIKRVYPQQKVLALVSPNPVDPRNPIILPVKELRSVWPVRGVLFRSSTVDLPEAGE